MKQDKEEVEVGTVFKLAGGFIAWIIGSGFATGQEVLQYFSSYGLMGYAAMALCLAGFIGFGQILMWTGYRHREEERFQQFKYFCGEKLGTAYSWVIPIALVALIAVLVSAAGTTVQEYYRINRYIGSAAMTVFILCAYLIGFQRLVKIVSSVSPLIIFFSLIVGTVSVVRDFGNFAFLDEVQECVRPFQASPSWILSGVLYLSMNFLCGSTYFTALGASAKNEKEARLAATMGSIAIMTTIAIISTAILLNGKDIAALQIPTLYLAKKLSSFFGGVFSIILFLGMFSSSSAMMWTACDSLSGGNEKRGKLVAISVSAIVFLLGLFPFGNLVSVIYPFIGYVSLIYLACVVNKQIGNK